MTPVTGPGASTPGRPQEGAPMDADPTSGPDARPTERADEAPASDELDLDLDLDLEEADDGDRLKEGFTGQER